MIHAKEFVKRAIDIATNKKTLYVMGCFGAPMTDKNKARYSKNHSYNRTLARQEMIQKADPDTFGFDCVCLLKAIGWGWNGDLTHVYGGAKYKSNDVPDCTISYIRNFDYSTDFSNIEIGEALYLPGHVGIYIGNGQAVECTPKWDNKVQITTVQNIKETGNKLRRWDGHGKIFFVDYKAEKECWQIKTTISGPDGKEIEISVAMSGDDLTEKLYKVAEIFKE